MAWGDGLLQSASFSPAGLGLLGAGTALLDAGGPSRTPRNFGQALSQGLQGGLQGVQMGLSIEQQKQQQRLANFRALAQAAQMEQAQMQAQAQKAAFERLRPTLPNDQQALFDADPQGFLKSYTESKFPDPAKEAGFYKQVGNDIVDVRTNRVVHSAPFAPQAPREMWSTLAPEQAKRMGLPEGVYQQSSQGQIRPLQTQSPELVAVQTPDGARLLPKSQAVGMSPADQREDKTFTQANQLRTQWNTLTKDHREVATAYRKVDEGFKQNSGPGDIAGVFGFMKMLDPGSVVREGEFATAQNSGGVPEYVRSMYNRLLEGDKLSPTQRDQLKSAAGSQITPYKSSFKSLADQYREISKRSLVNPDDVLTPVDWPDLAPQPGAADFQGPPASALSAKKQQYLQGR
jgi:hypothetical protein